VAAQVPSRPHTPVYLYSTFTEVTLGFTESSDDGGLQITNYVLQVSELLVTNWVDVVSYDGISLIHTVNTAADSLIVN